MSERSSRKIPVTERQFLWVQDDDKGEVILHVGPTMVSPTAADRVVIDDGQGGFTEDPSGRPQRMVEVSDGEYAVLYNPMVEREEGFNGRFRSGRNESKQLRNGTRDMIAGPCCFYLRPGQRAEVRDAHELASNQYLVVKVYGEVDVNAPYYEITARSAGITTATAEEVDSPSSSLDKIDRGIVKLTRGQLIVVRGLDTQFYIPPTGVDVVPDLSLDEGGRAISADAARKILASMPLSKAAAVAAPVAQREEFASEVQVFMDKMELADDDEYQSQSAELARKKDAPQEQPARRLQANEQAARLRQAVKRPSPPPPPPGPAAPELSRSEVDMLLGSDVHRKALEREIRKKRLIRQAVVLGEKEFCVIIDADGKRQIKVGPARVFPGPYDNFQTTGSNNRIYYAYELLPQRALWLRFIAPLSGEKLTRKLPRGVQLESENYHPGDELILTGVNSFFFPFNEVEVLHPLTGRPHVGNDHSDVFIEAIGIDQKSGIYVRDLVTGEARLVRGKQSYLVDPRKEVHITRTIPVDQWNMWVAVNEAHKHTREAITTPWAISITVPHNMAMMAASATGQRVIEGPCVELLGYEETLVTLNLSTGTPKSDDATLRTCFLCTVGNRVSDVILVETSDFVEINIRVSFRVTFEPGHKDKWFNHQNYIGVMCDHLRSLVRSHCRQMTLMELWPDLPARIRDIILGERTEGGRKGRLFAENGMNVTEVEVLASDILDREIASLLENVQRESVALQISDRQVSEKLRSEKLRHDIDRDRHEMRRQSHELQSTVNNIITALDHQTNLKNIAFTDAQNQRTAEAEATREALLLKSRLEREATTATAHVDRLAVVTAAEVDALKLRQEQEQAHKKAIHDLEVALIKVRSSATVAERQAVQPALVEALTAVGDKALLGAVAENMNLVSLFKGQDIGTILKEIVGGTSLDRTLKSLLPEDPA